MGPKREPHGCSGIPHCSAARLGGLHLHCGATSLILVFSSPNMVVGSALSTVSKNHNLARVHPAGCFWRANQALALIVEMRLCWSYLVLAQLRYDLKLLPHISRKPLALKSNNKRLIESLKAMYLKWTCRLCGLICWFSVIFCLASSTIADCTGASDIGTKCSLCEALQWKCSCQENNNFDWEEASDRGETCFAGQSVVDLWNRTCVLQWCCMHNMACTTCLSEQTMR